MTSKWRTKQKTNRTYHHSSHKNSNNHKITSHYTIKSTNAHLPSRLILITTPIPYASIALAHYSIHHGNRLSIIILMHPPVNLQHTGKQKYEPLAGIPPTNSHTSPQSTNFYWLQPISSNYTTVSSNASITFNYTNTATNHYSLGQHIHQTSLILQHTTSTSHTTNLVPLIYRLFLNQNIDQSQLRPYAIYHHRSLQFALRYHQ